jgi:S-methylmethionine-dependent homocysteine/selenocysteine methylase
VTTRLTDSGLETWLIFLRGIDLPSFASFTLLDEPEGGPGRAALAEYFTDHLGVAEAAGTGIVLETPTWRANPDWGARLGYDAAGLDRVNRAAVALVRDLAAQHPAVEVIVSGNLGPRGDGYSAGEQSTPEEARAYHRAQIDSFVAAGADRVTMLTATHAGEAAGVVLAAADAGIPAVVAFTVETDGRLPSGQPLHEAIAEVEGITSGSALHYGVNCAHPDHFGSALDADDAAIGRIGLIRANASRMSHAELDEAEELDDGDPAELASHYAALVARHPHLEVLGGCCGTDVRHVRAIAEACAS